MFALGIIALVIQTSLEFHWQEAKLIFDTSYTICVFVWSTITCVMHILCDIICAWRTVVIWNGDKRIITVLVLFILGTIATAGYALVTGLFTSQSPDDTHLETGTLDLIMICPTLATNLLSTGLIAWKAWQRRITVGKHLREGRRFVRVDRVFALLIESGLIYSFIWILYWISLGVLHFPGFTLIVLVSGLYPTLIIILVSKQMSPVDHYSTHLPEMQFTGVPALGPPRDGSMA